MLKLEDLKAMEPNMVFAQGIAINSPDDIYMTTERIGDELRWVAIRGGIHDWAIYVGWSEHSAPWVAGYGDKLQNPEYIKKLIPCSEEAYLMYRH